MAPPTPALRRPDWWQSRGLRACLWWLPGQIFFAFAALRRLGFRLGLFQTLTLRVPVIVVGNIAVGGSGKTPVVIWLAAALREKGWHPGILSRGYGGQATGPMAVGTHSDPLAAGDEPVLLARRTGCPLWVGRDRATTGSALLAAHPEVDVLITDDGLQHYRLHRDAEIVVLDEAILGNTWPLPAGPLREPLSRLASATLLLIHGQTSAALRTRLPQRPRAAMQLAAGHFYRLDAPSQTRSAADFAAVRLHALAGIANPERFFSTLRGLGLSLASTRALADHHVFSREDLSVPDGEVLLLTEKDAVKCSSFAQGEIWVLPVEACIESHALDHLLEHLHGPKTA